MLLAGERWLDKTRLVTTFLRRRPSKLNQPWKPGRLQHRQTVVMARNPLKRPRFPCYSFIEFIVLILLKNISGEYCWCFLRIQHVSSTLKKLAIVLKWLFCAHEEMSWRLCRESGWHFFSFIIIIHRCQYFFTGNRFRKLTIYFNYHWKMNHALLLKVSTIFQEHSTLLIDPNCYACTSC